MDDDSTQRQDDQSDIESGMVEIDAEGNEHAPGPSVFNRMQHFLPHHIRLVSVVVLCVICLLAGILLYPSAIALVRPKALVPTPVASFGGVSAAPGRDNVVFVLGTTNDGPIVYVAAYDTQSGALLWQTTSSKYSGVAYETAQGLASQTDDIYERDEVGQLSLLSPRSGDVLWTYPFSTTITFSSIYEYDDISFLSASDRSIYAIKDGHLLWHSTNAGELERIDDGIVYAFDSQRLSYAALDEKSGTYLWSYALLQPNATSTLLPDSLLPFATEKNIAYIQKPDNEVVAIRNGYILWTRQLDSSGSLYSDTHYLYATDSNHIYALNLLNGNVEHIYGYQADSSYIMSSQDGRLSVATDKGFVVFDINSGEVVLLNTGETGRTFIDGDLLVSASGAQEELIKVFDLQSVSLRWSGTESGRIWGIDGDRAILFTVESSTMSLLNLQNGKVLWSRHI